jgi:radical SAM superfamily enzyme YgiQ (UPF0313 family)
MQSDILLVTLNATYFHCAFGLRYLYANLEKWQSRSRILEFTLDQKAAEIAERILGHRPRIVGFGVYIWNTRQTEAVISILKRIAPEIVIVLGGPEVSYETESQNICKLADHVFKGEAEFLFRDFCENYFEKGLLPVSHTISGPLPEITSLKMPYGYYSEEDVAHRVLYVEASRGCPYKCEFCLSSLDKVVRNFPIEAFLSEMQNLLDRGARSFKFVDRTFNLSAAVSSKILAFFLERISLGLFLHFEMVPDRLPLELRSLIEKFPAGSLQFEIGIQTWNPEVATRVSRRQDDAKVEENFRFLTTKTGVHLHADLIAGLPGENLESFAAGFDRLAGLSPHEIQVGILKRLKGTPILRHDDEWGMVYQEEPPFAILRTRHMDFPTLQKVTRFAKFWDLYANSGNFSSTIKLIRESLGSASLFWMFWDFTDFLSRRHAKLHSIALLNLVESAWIYLRGRLGDVPEESWREALIQDYAGRIKRDVPRFLRREGSESITPGNVRMEASLPRRQTLHLKPVSAYKL